jgi:predicted phosphodiesterase
MADLRSRLLIAAVAVGVPALILAVGIRLHGLMGQMGCYALARDSVRIDPPPPVGGVTRFLVLGDTGTGSKEQRAVAESARRLCGQRGCDFAVLLGDNFYPHGLQRPGNRQVRKLIDQPYAALGIPLFALLGNHDIESNPIHQVKLSRRHPQWRMPNFRYDFQAGAARFHAVNSNCGALEWLRLAGKPKRRENSWTFVLAHHPILSEQAHGGARFPENAFWRWLIESDVDFLLSGHNHVLEHLQDPGKPQEYVVVGSSGGAPAEYDGGTKAKAGRSLFHSDRPGFAWFAVSEDRVDLEFFDSAGASLHRYGKTR